MWMSLMTRRTLVMMPIMTKQIQVIKEIGKVILGRQVACTPPQIKACSPPWPCYRGVLLLCHGGDEGSRVLRTNSSFGGEENKHTDGGASTKCKRV